MSDCPNVEIRELLPELMHGRLEAASAARVREHLAECAECAAELDLLERVRSVYAAGGPAVNTAAIVRALPAPRAHRAPVFASGRLLKIAAAIVIVLSGALVMRAVTSGPGTGGITVVDSTPVTPFDTQPQAMPMNGAPRVLAMSVSELDDLDVDELETLLGALDRIDAAPVAEPDTLIGSVSGIGS